MSTIARGSIRDRPLAEIYWCLHWMRLKGCLEVEQAPHKKSLYFRNGVGFFARSTMKSEALGKFLQSRRLISSEAYDSATLSSIQQGTKLGEALVRQGTLTQSALDAALFEQVRERFVAAFSLRQASWSWSPDIPEEVAAQRGQIPIVPMIRDGIARHLDFDTLSASLLPWSREVIVPTRTFALVMATVELTLEEQRVLSFVDGSRRLGDLFASSGMEPSKVVPVLYLAKCIGLLRGKNEPEPRILLEVPAEVPAPADGEFTAAPPPARRAPAPERATAELPVMSVPPPAAPPGASEGGRKSSPTTRDFGFVTHDEAMEIDEAAVARATGQPVADGHAGHGEGAHGKATGITKSFGFIRHLDEEVVMDVSDVSQPHAARAAPSGPPPRAAATSQTGGVQRVLDASQAFRRGESAFAKGQVALAIEEYDRALAIDPIEPEYLAAQCLAIYFYETAVMMAPRAAELERAHASAVRALQQKPGWSKALFARAMCAKALGKPEHENLLEEAVLLDPELRTLETRTRSRLRGEEPKGAGGNLLDRASKLFRR